MEDAESTERTLVPLADVAFHRWVHTVHELANDGNRPW